MGDDGIEIGDEICGEFTIILSTPPPSFISVGVVG